MAKVKAGLRGLSANQKATRAAVLYSQMNGNPNFPDPVPSMPEFHAAYIELKESILAALDCGRLAIARKDRAVQRIDEYMTRLAGYVNSACLGDIRKLNSSGFELVKRPAPINTLDVPRNFRVRATAYPEQLKARWERVPGAVIYQLERAISGQGDAEQWEVVDLTTRTSYVVSRMPSTVSQTFRVVAVGCSIRSPYSQKAYGKAI
ncbi:MAG: fibronectin type III domain-containing protein [Flavobacteriales bacterium]|nr:fibronectin type III domain-containing protein [Flavobacteriales bacterium]